ncbi:MAG: peptidoglycan recognition protein family protein [Sporichthyaceae bacterium]
MSVRGYCPHAGDPRTTTPKGRFAVALERLYDFEPIEERFRRAVDRIRDIRAEAESAYPSNFGYDPVDGDLPRLVDIPTQVRRVILHYTEGGREDLDGMAQAHLMSRIGRGTGYNYYVGGNGANATVYYTSGQFVYHVRGGNEDAFGVEVAACSQDHQRPKAVGLIVHRQSPPEPARKDFRGGVSASDSMSQVYARGPGLPCRRSRRRRSSTSSISPRAYLSVRMSSGLVVPTRPVFARLRPPPGFRTANTTSPVTSPQNSSIIAAMTNHSPAFQFPS